ncbi:tyrosinase family oxidase copper chaperone [Streptomyces sp. NPDC005566]|uniref:tyrosinase family oxidase copper chaperone n=1 Tax=Streptomyces sp. NPDC005566 TaxID=3156886 RepID=UPI0033AD1A6E
MDPTTGTSGAQAGRKSPGRRVVLRAAFTASMVAGTGGALAPILVTGQEARAGTAQDRTPAAVTEARAGGRGRPSGPERFAEMYRGRDIRGTAAVMVPAGGGAATGRTGALSATADTQVSIDGRTLHVMRRADGSYLSTVNHYESFPTLLETARAAVDEIGTAQLAKASPHTI